MKMAKATEQDIDAAGNAMSVLQTISGGYYPAREGEEDAPTFFDPEDPDHLRRFYYAMNATLDASPGWPGRVIGGMCYVILYPANEILNPDADTLELHPQWVKREAAPGVTAAQPYSLVGFLEKLRPLTDYGRPGTRDIEQAELRRALDSAITLARALTSPPWRAADAERQAYTLRRWIAAMETGVARMTRKQRETGDQVLAEMREALRNAGVTRTDGETEDRKA